MITGICGICKKAMTTQEDLGGDCVYCMADAGDPTALELLVKILKKDLVWALNTCEASAEILSEEDLDDEVFEVQARVTELRNRYRL